MVEDFIPTEKPLNYHWNILNHWKATETNSETTSFVSGSTEKNTLISGPAIVISQLC